MILRERIWPTGRWWLGGLVAIALATIVTVMPSREWGPQQWHVFTAQTREGVLLPGLVGGIVAARLGSVFSPKSVVVGRAAPQSRAVVRQHLLGVVTLCVLGYTLGIAPAMATTTFGADAGGPDWLALISVYTVLLAIAMFSYLLSSILPRGWARSVAPLLSVGTLALPAVLNNAIDLGERSMAQPAAIWLNQFPVLGWHLTTQTSLFRISFFTLVGVGCVLTLRRVATTNTGVPLILPAGIWTVATVMGATATAISPPLVAHQPIVPTCDERSEPIVCLAPSYASILPRVSEIASEVQDIAGPSRQVALFQQEPTIAEPNGSDTVWFRLEGLRSVEDLEKEIIVPMSNALSGNQACHYRMLQEQPDSSASEEFQLSFAMQQAISSTIQARSGLVPEPSGAVEATGEPVYSLEYERLQELTVTELQAWLAAHEDQVRECSWSVEDLP